MIRYNDILDMIISEELHSFRLDRIISEAIDELSEAQKPGSARASTARRLGYGKTQNPVPQPQAQPATTQPAQPVAAQPQAQPVAAQNGAQPQNNGGNGRYNTGKPKAQQRKDLGGVKTSNDMVNFLTKAKAYIDENILYLSNYTPQEVYDQLFHSEYLAFLQALSASIERTLSKRSLMEGEKMNAFGKGLANAAGQLQVSKIPGFFNDIGIQLPRELQAGVNGYRKGRDWVEKMAADNIRRKKRKEEEAKARERRRRRGDDPYPAGGGAPAGGGTPGGGGAPGGGGTPTTGVGTTGGGTTGGGTTGSGTTGGGTTGGGAAGEYGGATTGPKMTQLSGQWKVIQEYYNRLSVGNYLSALMMQVYKNLFKTINRVFAMHQKALNANKTGTF